MSPDLRPLDDGAAGADAQSVRDAVDDGVRACQRRLIIIIIYIIIIMTIIIIYRFLRIRSDF